MKTNPQLRVGMRIRLIKGIDHGEQPYMMWCAGNVPVGTCGTIYQRPSHPMYPDFVILAVNWDGITSKSNDTYFGMGSTYDPEYYEEVNNGTTSL